MDGCKSTIINFLNKQEKILKYMDGSILFIIFKNGRMEMLEERINELENKSIEII